MKLKMKWKRVLKRGFSMFLAITFWVSVCMPALADSNLPEIPEIPEITEVPEATPEVPETTPEVPEATPEVPEATPEVPEATPEVPEATPEVPEAAPEVPEAAPEVPEATPEVPEATPEAAEMPLELTGVVQAAMNLRMSPIKLKDPSMQTDEASANSSWHISDGMLWDENNEAAKVEKWTYDAESGNILDGEGNPIDFGTLQVKAEQNEDGTYKITFTEIDLPDFSDWKVEDGVIKDPDGSVHTVEDILDELKVEDEFQLPEGAKITGIMSDGNGGYEIKYEIITKVTESHEGYLTINGSYGYYIKEDGNLYKDGVQVKDMPGGYHLEKKDDGTYYLVDSEGKTVLEGLTERQREQKTNEDGMWKKEDGYAFTIPSMEDWRLWHADWTGIDRPDGMAVTGVEIQFNPDTGRPMLDEDGKFISWKDNVPDGYEEYDMVHDYDHGYNNCMNPASNTVKVYKNRYTGEYAYIYTELTGHHQEGCDHTREDIKTVPGSISFSKSGVIPGSSVTIPGLTAPAPSSSPSAAPSTSPSADPSSSPSADPSTSPSTSPSAAPSSSPSAAPSSSPSTNPSNPPIPQEIPDEGEPVVLTEIPDEGVPLTELADELMEISEEEVPADLVEIPEEAVPLAAIPVELVEIPDGDVPLAAVPDDLVEIPDEDVPLADVPETGDNSGWWYIVTFLAGAGWLAMNAADRKKRKIK